MKKILIAIVCFLIFQEGNAKNTDDSLFKKKNILAIMEKVADWQLKEWEAKGSAYRWDDWTNAAGYTGLYALSTISSKNIYRNVLIEKGEQLHWQTGSRRFFADDYCIGQMYCLLYSKYKDKKMILPFKDLADSICLLPHTEDLEWKDQIQLREWAWCDALFMGPTSLSYLSSVTGEKKYLDIALKLWWKTTDYLYDSSEHLFSRDGSYLNKKEKNGAKVFWSRGNGWVLAGLVRVLENMPQDHPDRKRLISLYKNMSLKIAELQQPDGTWHASLLDPASYPVQEMSGTGFFTYSLLWGINHKLLDRKKYWPIIQRSWKALTEAVHEDGMLGYVQPIGAAPNTVTAGSTEIYGVGAFLLAGNELYRCMKH